MEQNHKEIIKRYTWRAFWVSLMLVIIVIVGFLVLPLSNYGVSSIRRIPPEFYCFGLCFAIPFVVFFTWNAGRATKRILLRPTETKLYYLSPALPALFALFLFLLLFFIYAQIFSSSPEGIGFLSLFLVFASPIYFVALYILGVMELYVIKHRLRRLLKK